MPLGMHRCGDKHAPDGANAVLPDALAGAEQTVYKQLHAGGLVVQSLLGLLAVVEHVAQRRQSALHEVQVQRASPRQTIGLSRPAPSRKGVHLVCSKVVAAWGRRGRVLPANNLRGRVSTMHSPCAQPQAASEVRRCTHASTHVSIHACSHAEQPRHDRSSGSEVAGPVHAIVARV
jgi:hypothetical protein